MLLQSAVEPRPFLSHPCHLLARRATADIGKGRVRYRAFISAMRCGLRFKEVARIGGVRRGHCRSAAVLSTLRCDAAPQRLQWRFWPHTCRGGQDAQQRIEAATLESCSKFGGGRWGKACEHGCLFASRPNGFRRTVGAQLIEKLVEAIGAFVATCTAVCTFAKRRDRNEWLEKGEKTERSLWDRDSDRCCSFPFF